MILKQLYGFIRFILDRFLIILLAFTIRPVAGFITLIANLFFKDMTTTTMTQKVMQNLSLSILTTAFLPGLVEETIFRGVVYSRVRKANPIKGILLSALFFGIAHMNFQQFCYAFSWNRLWLPDRSL